MNTKMTCKICNKKLLNYKALSSHIRQIHKIDSKSYYDTYIASSKKDCKCKNCSNQTQFISLSKGYKDYCSIKCKKLYIGGLKNE